MRKVFQSAKYKKWSQKKSRKAQRKQQKSRKNKKRYRVKKYTTPRKKDIKRAKHKVTVVAPHNFSIINNTEETLKFFNEIRALTKSVNNIFLDMSRIKHLTSDAILYILSLLDYMNKKYRFIVFGGNYPRQPDCKKLFIQSGFLRYVHSNLSVISTTTNIFSIELGKKVKPEIAQKVVNFTRKHLNQAKSFKSRRTYETIIECMCNTNAHAYEFRSPLPKWYLMASKSKTGDSISFTFLDGGFGIPATVKRKNAEKVKQIFSFLRVINVKDNDLMFSVLNGDFRTRTEVGYRGKGIPRIYQRVKSNEINNLVLIANNGYVNCTTNKRKELKNKFHGTLFSWEFV